jgi:hypothetical protein
VSALDIAVDSALFQHHLTLEGWNLEAAQALYDRVGAHGLDTSQSYCAPSNATALTEWCAWHYKEDADAKQALERKAFEIIKRTGGLTHELLHRPINGDRRRRGETCTQLLATHINYKFEQILADDDVTALIDWSSQSPVGPRDTPLTLAINSKQADDRVERLIGLTNDSGLNAVAASGYSALTLALSLGRPGVFRALLRRVLTLDLYPEKTYPQGVASAAGDGTVVAVASTDTALQRAAASADSAVVNVVPILRSMLAAAKRLKASASWASSSRRSGWPQMSSASSRCTSCNAVAHHTPSAQSVPPVDLTTHNKN